MDSEATGGDEAGWRDELDGYSYNEDLAWDIQEDPDAYASADLVQAPEDVESPLFCAPPDDLPADSSA